MPAGPGSPREAADGASGFPPYKPRPQRIAFPPQLVRPHASGMNSFHYLCPSRKFISCCIKKIILCKTRPCAREEPGSKPDLHIYRAWRTIKRLFCQIAQVRALAQILSKKLCQIAQVRELDQILSKECQAWRLSFSNFERLSFFWPSTEFNLDVSAILEAMMLDSQIPHSHQAGESR